MVLFLTHLEDQGRYRGIERGQNQVCQSYQHLFKVPCLYFGFLLLSHLLAYIWGLAGLGTTWCWGSAAPPVRLRACSSSYLPRETCRRWETLMLSQNLRFSNFVPDGTLIHSRNGRRGGWEGSDVWCSLPDKKHPSTGLSLRHSIHPEVWPGHQTGSHSSTSSLPGAKGGA